MKKFRPVGEEYVGMCWDHNYLDWVGDSEALGIKTVTPHPHDGQMWLVVTLRNSAGSSMLRPGEWMLFAPDGSTRLWTAEKLEENYTEVTD